MEIVEKEGGWPVFDTDILNSYFVYLFLFFLFIYLFIFFFFFCQLLKLAPGSWVKYGTNLHAAEGNINWFISETNYVTQRRMADCFFPIALNSSVVSSIVDGILISL